MYITEIRLTFETLEQAMNLPDTVKVVAVQEEDIKGIVKVRVVSTTPPPEEYTLPHISMVGEAYRHPEKFKAGPHGPGKGATRGESPQDSGSGGEAVVDVLKAPQE